MMMKAKIRKLLTPGQILLSLGMILFLLTILIPLLNILARSISDPQQSPLMKGLEVCRAVSALLTTESSLDIR